MCISDNLFAIAQIADEEVSKRAFIFILESILKDNPDLTFMLWSEGYINQNDFDVNQDFGGITPTVGYDIEKINLVLLKI